MHDVFGSRETEQPGNETFGNLLMVAPEDAGSRSEERLFGPFFIIAGTICHHLSSAAAARAAQAS
jgi:hypothetical protein